MQAVEHQPGVEFESIKSAMKALGYRPGPPRHARQGAEIDLEVCREAECDRCGATGLTFRPFHKGGSYAAYAECPVCGRVDEF